MEPADTIFKSTKQTNGCSYCATPDNYTTANNKNSYVVQQRQRQQQQHQQQCSNSQTVLKCSRYNSNINSNNNKSQTSIKKERSNKKHSFNYKKELLLIMTLATLLPMPEARHVHKVLRSDAAALPAWHVNPFHGLGNASDISDSQSLQGNGIGTGSSRSSYDDIDVDNDLESDLVGLSSASSSSSASASLSSSSHSESHYTLSSTEDAAQLPESLSEEITAYAAAAAALRDLRALRIRQRRRRSHHLHYFSRDEEKSQPEWINPCGGVYDPHPASMHVSKTPVNVRKHLITLRNYTRMELAFMNETHRVINVSDIKDWSYHESLYNFLPALKNSSKKVTLKTWYADMQTYVASFARLGRTQYKFEKGHHVSEMTHELHDLLLSARRVLCEIETTVNKSYPTRNIGKLTDISREAMNERLKFITDTQSADGVEIARVDAIFAKAKYFQYLDTMWKVLRHHTRRQRASKEYSRHSGAAAATASSENISLLGSESSEHRTRARSNSRYNHQKRNIAAIHKRRMSAESSQY